jgi:hypothetical protein
MRESLEALICFAQMSDSQHNTGRPAEPSGEIPATDSGIPKTLDHRMVVSTRVLAQVVIDGRQLVSHAGVSANQFTRHCKPGVQALPSSPGRHNREMRTHQSCKVSNEIQRSRQKDWHNCRSIIQKLSELMKECKSTEARNTRQMPISRGTKLYSQLRMSNLKDGRIPGSRSWKLFRRMKECKSIEVSNTSEMQIRQESKLYTPIQM